MKALTACLYCNKKKECPESVKAHSFLDECFESEDESIREALKDLGMLSKITLPVEVFEKTNSVAGVLVDQAAKMKKLCNYIAYGNCELVCVHANEYPCTSIIQCYECDEMCSCRDCKDFSKFEINWDKPSARSHIANTFCVGSLIFLHYIYGAKKIKEQSFKF